MVAPAALTYAKLQAAGLSGQPLKDAFTMISDGDTTFEDVLKVVGILAKPLAVLPVENIDICLDLINAFEQEGYSPSETISVLQALGSKHALGVQFILQPETISLKEDLAAWANVEPSDITAEEGIELIGELQKEGFAGEDIVRVLRAVRARHAAELVTKASEPAEAVAELENPAVKALQ